jgi:hypothetical protein
MNFLDLNDDVKLIITKNLLNDFKFEQFFLSKHHDLHKKKILGEFVFDDDFCKILKIQNDVKENDDFKNVKYVRFIKISIMSYILVVHVIH